MRGAVDRDKFHEEPHNEHPRASRLPPQLFQSMKVQSCPASRFRKQTSVRKYHHQLRRDRSSRKTLCGQEIVFLPVLIRTDGSSLLALCERGIDFLVRRLFSTFIPRHAARRQSPAVVTEGQVLTEQTPADSADPSAYVTSPRLSYAARTSSSHFSRSKSLAFSPPPSCVVEIIEDESVPYGSCRNWRQVPDFQRRLSRVSPDEENESRSFASMRTRRTLPTGYDSQPRFNYSRFRSNRKEISGAFRTTVGATFHWDAAEGKTCFRKDASVGGMNSPCDIRFAGGSPGCRVWSQRLASVRSMNISGAVQIVIGEAARRSAGCPQRVPVYRPGADWQ